MPGLVSFTVSTYDWALEGGERSGVPVTFGGSTAEGAADPPPPARMMLACCVLTFCPARDTTGIVSVRPNDTLVVGDGNQETVICVLPRPITGLFTLTLHTKGGEGGVGDGGVGDGDTPPPPLLL